MPSCFTRNEYSFITSIIVVTVIVIIITIIIIMSIIKKSSTAQGRALGNLHVSVCYLANYSKTMT